MYALITDSKQPEFVQTPMLSSEESKVLRTGTLKLSSEGVLEGDLRELHSGNRAADWRERFGKANNAEREEAVREEIKHRFADFDLTEIKVSNPVDLKLPIGFTYHIVVRGYAQRTGKRLFVLPNFFAAGYGARFNDSERTQAVYFEYPWSEIDAVDIQLPEGYKLDHPDAPLGTDFAPVGFYSTKLSISKSNVLIYRRDLKFGTDKILVFDAKVYPTLKKIFDNIHKGDNHLITLKLDDQPTPTAAQ